MTFIAGMIAGAGLLLWLAWPKRIRERDTTGWVVREWYKL